MKDIPNDFTEIYIIIREDCQQLYVNKLDNEDEMDTLKKKTKKVVTETDLRKIENLNTHNKWTWSSNRQSSYKSEAQA